MCAAGGGEGGGGEITSKRLQLTLAWYLKTEVVGRFRNWAACILAIESRHASERRCVSTLVHNMKRGGEGLLLMLRKTEK